MKRITVVLLTWALAFGVAHSSEPTYFDPPDYHPDGPRADLPDTVIAKFIFISFRDHPDTLLHPAFVDTIPGEFKAFFLDQSRGGFTVECSTVIDPREDREGLQWVAKHPYSDYADSLVSDYEEYRGELARRGLGRDGL